MPVQPDPTHPKFLEGDDVLAATEDDVSGHLSSAGAEASSSEPEDLQRHDDEDTDDVEGHVQV